MGNIVLEKVAKIYLSTHKTIEDIVAVDDTTCQISDKEIVSLVGPSGCGKTTILNMIAGFEPPSRGVIKVGGNTVNGAGPDRMVVFQSPALFPWMTVMENIILGPRKKGIPKKQYMPEAQRYVSAVGLDKFTAHYPYQLSGGMRQRVQIARALINRPEVLLMDEPFGALDAQTRLSMQELVLQVWAEFQPTIVFITHDVEEAVFLSDRVMVMSRRPGRVKTEIVVPFAKPRQYEILAAAEFVKIKDRILHLIREEDGSQERGPACGAH